MRVGGSTLELPFPSLEAILSQCGLLTESWGVEEEVQRSKVGT